MKSENSAAKESRARQRMLLILRVQAGTKTATEAAAELGVSRQTFHQWEKRGLHALFQAMEEQASGRPPTPENPELEALKQQVQRLEHDLAITEQIAQMRGSLLRQLEQESVGEPRPQSKKKTGGSEKSSVEPKK
jgi:transposase